MPEADSGGRYQNDHLQTLGGHMLLVGSAVLLALLLSGVVTVKLTLSILLGILILVGLLSSAS